MMIITTFYDRFISCHNHVMPLCICTIWEESVAMLSLPRINSKAPTVVTFLIFIIHVIQFIYIHKYMNRPVIKGYNLLEILSRATKGKVTPDQENNKSK